MKSFKFISKKIESAIDTFRYLNLLKVLDSLHNILETKPCSFTEMLHRNFYCYFCLPFFLKQSTDISKV